VWDILEGVTCDGEFECLHSSQAQQAISLRHIAHKPQYLHLQPILKCIRSLINTSTPTRLHHDTIHLEKRPLLTRITRHTPPDKSPAQACMTDAGSRFEHHPPTPTRTHPYRHPAPPITQTFLPSSRTQTPTHSPASRKTRNTSKREHQARRTVRFRPRV
jgi:hypothetical protein